MSAKSVNHLFKPDLDNVGIDMSHCKLVFKDFESAMNSLRENQREEVVENVFKLDMNGKEVPKGNVFSYGI